MSLWKSASAICILLYLDFVVIPTGHKERLLFMEINSSNGSFVLVEFFKQGAHAVVPKLNNSVVQTVNVE